MLRLLDLFCGAGGAAAGYRKSGFHVTGIDIKPIWNYAGHRFIQTDAIKFLTTHGMEFDAIHCSPPCQAYSLLTKMHKTKNHHPDLISACRTHLIYTNKPWIIENTPAAPLYNPVVLCGSMFGLSVRRHRHFEISAFELPEITCQHHKQRYIVGVYGNAGGSSTRGDKKFHTKKQRQAAMGIDWMTVEQMSEAIPPAYTFHIGTYLYAHITSRL